MTYSHMLRARKGWSMSSRHGIHCVAASVLTLTWLLLGLPLGAQTWTQLEPTGGPPTGRGAASAILDSVTNQMIVFGGVGGGLDFGDAWSLTTSGSPQWTLVTPAGSGPAARGGHTAVYDSANSRMTIFGGGEGQSAP